MSDKVGSPASICTTWPSGEAVLHRERGLILGGYAADA